ncbi:Protein TIFY 5A -like protein [Tripterygium wilfordii]|uniref:Protein TIFY 5A -like protein n=1 Tax=Tripterygium wilfordii TaxID=458696 RepID=A0A7J7CQI5_TRIWF|nr:protein TIFY 5A-like [Tripterygium wilfordii]KAF5736268.1 Protein TIFY 5A -like protein [Tripterygium wilfordii]
MKRNCNLELRLFSLTADSDSDSDQHQSPEVSSRITRREQLQQQQQQLTISSINGRVGVSHVSELQGRAIISLATREIGERVKTNLIRCNETSVSSANNLSMKISLQRFLQKRKCRIQATSPYHRPSQ